MNDSDKKQSLALAEHYFRSNNHQFAEHILNTIIKIDPNNSKANELLAYIYGNKGDFKTSYQLLEKSCSKDDCSPEALYYLGSAQLKLNLYEKAVESFKKSLKKAGIFFEALHDLGTTYGHLGKTQEALLCYQDCLKFNRNSYELYFNIAKTLDDLKRHNEAIEYYDQALKIKPDFEKAWSNKGVALNDLRRHNEALASYDKAILLKLDYAEAWVNKGTTLSELKRYDEALTHYDKAIQFNQDCYSAYWNKACTSLLLGNFKVGWDLYDSRWKTKEFSNYRHENIAPLTSLDYVFNKKILVWHEQGFGDTIQFSRYIPKLIELGAIVTFEIQEPLLNLFKSQLDCVFVSAVNNDSNFDFQVPLLSLPKLFNTSIDSIPNPTPIQITSEDIANWKKKLNISDKKLNIGLAISGNPNHKNDSNRSMKLDDISPLFDVGEFFLLQKEINRVDLDNLNKKMNLNFLGDDIDDFVDTASIIMNMDLIISVDTSLIHLAGSLNKRSYLMLPWCPEWRWLLDKSDSPWYPSIKIFRQKSLGDWNSVIEDIKAELSILMQQ